MPRLLLELGWLSGRPFGMRGGLWSWLGAHPSAPLIGAAVCWVFLVHKIQLLQFFLNSKSSFLLYLPFLYSIALSDSASVPGEDVVLLVPSKRSPQGLSTNNPIRLVFCHRMTQSLGGQ